MRRLHHARARAAFEANKARSRADPPPAYDPLPRIDALTRNARNTWFVLLGVLVFVGVTLMGVEHIDFYGVDRATALPLVDVTVPTSLFFIAAPILTAAAYGYFHLYLIRLWDALGAADARIGGRPLGDAVTPWLVSDAALNLRRILRKEEPPPTNRRALDTVAMWLNLLLAWGFGLVVLGFAWWLTQPARDTFMNLVAAASLVAGLVTGGYSLFALVDRVGHFRKIYRHTPGIIAGFAAVFLGLYSVIRTGEAVGTLAPVDLSGEAVAEKPADWLPYDIAKKDFLAVWCRREQADCKSTGDDGAPGYDVDAFEAEWRRRREAAIAALRKPDLSGRDLRGAQIFGTFLSGVDLREAQMEGAVLIGTQMEGADLRLAQMEVADLRGAQMEGANLFGAQMEGADLNGAQMEGAVLRVARMEGVVLSEAQMEGADLSYSLLTGTPDRPNVLQSTNLGATTNHGGALRFVDLSKVKFDAATVTRWRNSFGDGTVLLPQGWPRPCQWAGDPLDDAAFYGRWRGWIETVAGNEIWRFLAPPGFEDVPAVPPPPGCSWKTEPDPAAEAE